MKSFDESAYSGDAIVALEKERDEARAQVERLKEQVQIQKVIREVDKVTSYSEEQYKSLQLTANSYRAKLLKYGGHTSACRWSTRTILGADSGSCECGWSSEAREALEGK